MDETNPLFELNQVLEWSEAKIGISWTDDPSQLHAATIEARHYLARAATDIQASEFAEELRNPILEDPERWQDGPLITQLAAVRLLSDHFLDRAFSEQKIFRELKSAKKWANRKSDVYSRLSQISDEALTKLAPLLDNLSSQTENNEISKERSLALWARGKTAVAWSQMYVDPQAALSIANEVLDSLSNNVGLTAVREAAFYCVYATLMSESSDLDRSKLWQRSECFFEIQEDLSLSEALKVDTAGLAATFAQLLSGDEKEDASSIAIDYYLDWGEDIDRSDNAPWATLILLDLVKKKIIGGTDTIPHSVLQRLFDKVITSLTSESVAHFVCDTKVIAVILSLRSKFDLDQLIPELVKSIAIETDATACLMRIEALSAYCVEENNEVLVDVWKAVLNGGALFQLGWFRCMLLRRLSSWEKEELMLASTNCRNLLDKPEKPGEFVLEVLNEFAFYISTIAAGRSDYDLVSDFLAMNHESSHLTPSTRLAIFGMSSMIDGHDSSVQALYFLNEIQYWKLEEKEPHELSILSYATASLINQLDIDDKLYVRLLEVQESISNIFVEGAND